MIDESQVGSFIDDQSFEAIVEDRELDHVRKKTNWTDMEKHLLLVTTWPLLG